MSAPAADFGKLTGMSLYALRDDIEVAAALVKSLGFEAIEIHASQIGPALPGVPVFEAHAAAVGAVVRNAGLVVSTLNVVGDASFDPFGGPHAFEGTVAGLASHLRWAAAMGAPRILIWEGRVSAREDVAPAAKTLARAIEEAKRRSNLADLPAVSCELHPFTFALKHRAIAELAAALQSVDAGICFDFCHFAVALGRDLLPHLDDRLLRSINHIHYADSDVVTSELHFPPSQGVLDLDAIADRLVGVRAAAGWDLFGWPGPRQAVRAHMDRYRKFVRRHAGAADPP